MHDRELMTTQPLGGFDRQHTDVSLSEITDYALVSMAIPLGRETDLQNEMEKKFGTNFPKCGRSTIAADGHTQFLGMQKDQAFVLFKFDGDDAVGEIANALGDAAYYTDQSDSWAMLEISGPLARSTLERICPLDLDQDVFAFGAVTRTMMEHLAIIIMRTNQDTFLLMSPRSSADSFLHLLETTIEHVL